MPRRKLFSFRDDVLLMRRMVNKKVVAALLALALVLVVAFHFYWPAKPMMVVSIQQVLVEQGHEENGYWVEGWWVITFTVDIHQSFLLLELGPENQTTSPDGQYRLQPAKALRIEFYPEQLYWHGDLRREEWLYARKAVYSSYDVVYYSEWDYDYVPVCDHDEKEIPDQYVTVWYPEPGWKLYLHTPFTVKVYLDDELINGPIYVDPKGPVDDIDEVVSQGVWEDLYQGKIKLYSGAQLVSGNIPQMERPIFVGGIANAFVLGTDVNDFKSDVKSFDTYWYGDYWCSHGYHMAKWVEDTPVYAEGYEASWVDEKGGWIGHEPYASDYYLEAEPRQPTVGTLASYLRESHEVYNRPSWCSEWRIEEDKLVMYSSEHDGEALCQLWISTDLVDTIAYQPYAGQFNIKNAYWRSSGTDYAEIAYKDTLIVEVENEADYDATCYLTLQPDNTIKNYISYPTGQVTATIPAHGTYTFELEITNLGVPAETEGSITIIVENTIGYQWTAQVSLKLVKPMAWLMVWTVGDDNKATIYVDGQQVARNEGSVYQARVPAGTHTVGFGTPPGYVFRYMIITIDGATETVEEPLVSITINVGETAQVVGYFEKSEEAPTSVPTVEAVTWLVGGKEAYGVVEVSSDATDVEVRVRLSKTPGVGSGTLTLEVYDEEGTLVAEKAISLDFTQQSTYTISVSFTAHVPGTYQVRLLWEGNLFYSTMLTLERGGVRVPLEWLSVGAAIIAVVIGVVFYKRRRG